MPSLFSGCECCGEHLFGSGGGKCGECLDATTRNTAFALTATVVPVLAIVAAVSVARGGEKLRDLIVTHLSPLTVVLSFMKILFVVVTLGSQWTPEVQVSYLLL